MKGICLIAAFLALVGCSGNQPHPDAEAIVAARQQGMTEMAGEMAALGRMLMSGTADTAATKQHALRLAALADRIPAWFPEGTGPGAGVRTLAKRDIWRYRDGFDGEAKGLRRAADAVAAIAASGDLGLIKQRAMELDAICVSCHGAFRDETAAAGEPGKSG